ncbi:glycosyltransferase family 2 protein [Sulfitobacter pseudonitzschiae]|uniref:Glycosyltransferase family 2 protein n=1 Tax=Pseudosulfitobacter pseudonitzschiae TaxID=1402135 RepID=A0A9Q2P6C3_9RHOB|nr:glycosyltransferase family 2 protein [Pseudosulfitobacter pseudonitzschiae]MBM2294570.1 glycosyltransferase family 2 protein [Pseudosulfitobacter pseudonitzschiae]MBM2299537.1 glycosyltransferase family 2 protein [Pseudosulfitobacter pseudonitzschiae]MBM2304437.1 glycosyltransferase family 2 protein [Pseudosulfitobacter pseudonitzschiae]MBM2314183.1 glycosyltransferase family 2 protein [Pseudosulfitobacter pseudonitzschiae]MBM2319098.1 glycosyltransferase family 2 protein [Pseudosulfitobact
MISVVTICHNSYDLLKHYSASFLEHHTSQEDRENIEIILVENSGDARTEEHARRLREAGFSTKVKMTENRGFGAGCNEGVAIADGELVVLVNPDIIFLTSLSSLEQAFGADDWGTAIQHNGDRGINALDLRPEYRSMLSEVARIYRWLYRWKPLYRFAYPVGSLFVVSRVAFDAVGGFDERFFLYYEEAELSRRLVAQFGPPKFCRSVEVLHEGGGTQPSSEFMMREEARSMVLYANIIGQPNLAQRRLAGLRQLARLRPALATRAAFLERALKGGGDE